MIYYDCRKLAGNSEVSIYLSIYLSIYVSIYIYIYVKTGWRGQ